MHAKRNDKNVPLNNRRPNNGKACTALLGRNITIQKYELKTFIRNNNKFEGKSFINTYLRDVRAKVFKCI